MKKRILSLLLACALTVGLLPVLSVTSLAAQQPANLYTTCNTGSAAPSDSVQFSTAYVRNYNTGAAGNGTAGKLEVVVNLKAVADNSVSIFAMVMRADNYAAALPGGPATSGLSGDNYYGNPTLSSAANVNYYAIARRPYNSTTDKSGLELRMPLVIPNAANSNNMANDVAVSPSIVKSMAVPSVTGTGASANYYVKYKLVVFSMGNTGARDTQYYVDDFYLDADGYVCTPSYALRYNGNNPNTTNAGTYGVGNLPARVITRASWAAAKATWPPTGGTPAIPGINVTNQKPTRQGFTFVGWSTTAIPFLQPGDDAAAKVTAAGGTFYQGTGSEPFACPGGGAFQVNEIYDLYAVWRIVPIQFDKTKAVAGTDTYKNLIAAGGAAYTGVTDPNGVTEYRLTLTPEPQVNVYYSSGDQALTQAVTNVTKNWAGVVQSVAKDGTITPHGSAITRSNDYGIAVGGASNNAAWSLSTNTGQGPKTHSGGDEVRFVLKVTEPTNDTYDIITVVFSQIRKGEQPVPTLDANTGVQPRVDERTVTTEPTEVPKVDGDGNPVYVYTAVDKEAAAALPTETPLYKQVNTAGEGEEEKLEYVELTTEERAALDTFESTIYTRAQEMETKPGGTEKVTDGQLYGFYSNGPALGTSVTDPESGYFDKDTANNAGLNHNGTTQGAGTMSDYYLKNGMVYEYMPKGAETEGLPNGGWREIPLPSTWYDAGQQTALDAALALRAKTVLNSAITTSGSIKTAGKATTGTAVAPEGFEGWPKEYGYIVFDETSHLPEVHGLAEGAEFLVRFRGTANSEPSAAREITISGGGGGGGSGDPGEVDMSKVKTITFYDWDGSTKLGVVAVEAGRTMGAADYATMMENRYDHSVMSLSGFDMTPTATEGYIYNPGRASAETAMVTDKGGYTFVGWVPGDAEVDHYPMGTDLSTIGLIDWTTYTVEDHIDVKACYVGNSKCDTTGYANYTLEYEDITRVGVNYTVRINISRYYSAERDCFPVRMQEPVLVAALSVGAAGVSVPVYLDNKDYTSASFTVPGAVGRVQFYAADIDGANGIALSAASRSDPIDMYSSDVANSQNFLKAGSLYLLNERAASAASTATTISGFTTASNFAQLGITVGNASAARTLSGQYLKAWRAANEWTTENGAANPEHLVALTHGQLTAIQNSQPNVYLKDVSFTDTDNRAGHLGGTINMQTVNVTDSSVLTAAPASFKFYFSRDAITKGTEITDHVGDGYVLNGVQKSSADRYLLICAVDSSGAELPVSAAIPIIDLACD